MHYQTQIVADRLQILATITDEPGSICRTFLSPAMQRVNEVVAGWMRKAGLEVEIDGWGNLIGSAPAASPSAPVLVLGSHLDTVRHAGKYDGPMGVLLALAAVEIIKQKWKLPFRVEIVGFSDEEGTRFHSTYLGSKALIGLIDQKDLALRDASGVTLEQAVAAYQKQPNALPPPSRYENKKLLGYIELHIEQGPVLEQQNLALGVVDSIASQTRLSCNMVGKAGHAGTTPMALRQDALAGVAELMVWMETEARKIPSLVATVGQLKVQPDVSNVIPSQVQFSVDLRHPHLETALEFYRRLHEKGESLATQRRLQFRHSIIQSHPGIACDPGLIHYLDQAVQATQIHVPHLISGAGHDGVVFSQVAPIAMLFVRCRDGLSHHPDEHVDLKDMEKALAALVHFLENYL